MNLILHQLRCFKLQLVGAMLCAVVLGGCSADAGPGGAASAPGPVPAPGTNAPAPTINGFTATPSTVPAGGMTSLAHTTTGAVSCVASGAWTGPQPTSGNTSVTVSTVPGSYTHGLTCTNATGQQTTRFVTVTVTGANTNDGGILAGTLLPNDGTTPTAVFDNGVPITGNFICTASARAYGNNPITAVRVNGLVGSAVTDLLDLLGAGTTTQLLNSVTAKELAVDGNLDTAAQYNLTAGLLGGLISSIDLFVGLNTPAPVGKYAVFALSFPIAAAELSLLQSVTITTFLGETQVETIDIDASTLDLLGQVATGSTTVYAGLRALQPYDGVTISLNPTVVSANISNAMNVHELCTDGFFNLPPP